MSYTPRLKEKYRNEIKQTLQERFNYKSVMSAPRLEKIVLSQGMGEAVADKKLIDSAAADLSRIAGQKAITTISKKDISNFKLRKGMPIGTKVTLRGTACTTSSIVYLPLLYHVPGTSAVLIQRVLTGAATSTSVSRSISFFQKSISIKSIVS